MKDMDKTVAPQRNRISDAGNMTIPGLRDRKKPGYFSAGDLIMHRYKVLSILGQGGMGVVCKCLDETAGVVVALKALPLELSRNTSEMEYIKENFQLVSKLVHQNIAVSKQLEKDTSNGNYYLIMECCAGEDLQSWIRRKRKAGGLAAQEILPVVRQVAEALDYAHRQRIVHRDIKPGNIMIDENGDVKVLDFGLAAQIRTSLSRVSIAYHGISGTVTYMAPEQWRGRRQGAAADQYALAVMTYEMFAGHLPFESVDPGVLKRAVLEEQPEEIPHVSRTVQLALKRAMSKDPAKRFESCSAFAAALEGKKLPAIREIFSLPASWKKILAAFIILLLFAVGAGLNLLFEKKEGTPAKKEIKRQLPPVVPEKKIEVVLPPPLPPPPSVRPIPEKKKEEVLPPPPVRPIPERKKEENAPAPLPIKKEIPREVKITALAGGREIPAILFLNRSWRQSSEKPLTGLKKDQRYTLIIIGKDPEGILHLGRMDFMCSWSGRKEFRIGLQKFPGLAQVLRDETMGFQFSADKRTLLKAPLKTVSYTVPEGVYAIGPKAFSGCTRLTHIHFPESLKRIGEGAFWLCRRAHLQLPAGITQIDGGALYQVPSFTLHPECRNFRMDERGVLIDTVRQKIIQAPHGISGSYRVPDSIKSIGGFAFWGCSRLTNVVLPEGVTRIERGGFGHCRRLSNFSLPRSMTYIGDDAFFHCISMTGITFEEGVIHIGARAFVNCRRLTGITLPESVEFVGDQAFAHCRSLHHIKLPGKVKNFGKNVFYKAGSPSYR